GIRDKLVTGVQTCALPICVGLDPVGLGVLLALDLLEVLEIPGGGGERELLGDQEVTRVSVGDVADLAPAPDLRDIVEQDDLHGPSPPPGTAAGPPCAPA